MYIPKHFEQNDPTALRRVIEAYPLAILVANTDAGLCANHIPLRLTEHETGELCLQGHIAKSNDLWREASGSVLAVFQGAEKYITPGMYPSKQEHGKVVPTWNYIAVHVYGRIKFIDEPGWKKTFLEQLTDVHESSQENPWAMSDAPTTYTEKMLEYLIGFEIGVERMTGKWKLSQNQSEKDRLGVIDGLSGSNDAAGNEIASAMAERDGKEH